MSSLSNMCLFPPGTRYQQLNVTFELSPQRRVLEAGLSASVFRPIRAVAFAGVVTSELLQSCYYDEHIAVARTSHFRPTFAVTSEPWAAWPCQKIASWLIGLLQASLPYPKQPTTLAKQLESWPPLTIAQHREVQRPTPPPARHLTLRSCE